MSKKELMAEYFFSKLGLKKGYFVDIGANDGKTGSFTYSLEKNGWKGVLIEPNPVLAENLNKIRSSLIFQNAISSKEADLEFFIVEGPSNLHGLSRLKIDPAFKKHIERHNGIIKKHIVKALTISEILDKAQAKDRIDFLKIDVEGHELEVLKGLDFKRFSPRIIAAEDNTKDSDNKVRKYLYQKGYYILARSGMNNWYAKKEDLFLFKKDRLKAKIIFLRWKIKRAIYKIVGKEYKSNYI